MKRVFITVLDGAGAGWLPDAARYGDEGASTISHVVERCHPALPNMARLGLGQIEPLGYPAEGAHPSRLHADRKPLEELVKYL